MNREQVRNFILAFATVFSLTVGLSGCETTGVSATGGSSTKEIRDGKVTDSSSVIPDSNDESDERRRARIRLELAAGYYQQGNYSTALSELRQALTVDPNYAAAYGVLGLVYMDLNDRPKADESFQRALKLSPRDANLNNNYGWYLCQTGREPASLTYFNQALDDRLYSTPAKPLHNAGICSLRMGDAKNAEAYFRRAFQVDPSNPVAMYQLALLKMNGNDFEQARFYSKRLLDSFDQNPQTLLLATCIERKASNRDAEANFGSQLRRKFPGSSEATRLQSNDCNLQ